MEMQTHREGNEDTSSTEACRHTHIHTQTHTHTHNHSLGKQVEGVQAFIFFYRRCAKSIFNAWQGEAAVSP